MPDIFDLTDSENSAIKVMRWLALAFFAKLFADRAGLPGYVDTIMMSALLPADKAGLPADLPAKEPE